MDGFVLECPEQSLRAPKKKATEECEELQGAAGAWGETSLLTQEGEGMLWT